VLFESNSTSPETGTLYQENAEVGVVTSSAWSPVRNAIIALAYVKTSVAEGSQLYFSGEGLLKKIPVKIVPLPIV
jgi:glycine cleavage system aminomethyltransferase T